MTQGSFLVKPLAAVWVVAALLLLAGPSAWAQNTPRITGVFPAGIRAGDTVDVSVRGGNLLGAKALLFTAPGGIVENRITSEIAGGGNSVDASAKPLFSQKCANCHELRSQSNRSYSPEQWADIVTRMIKQHSAPIAPDEATKITGYLQALARAGELKVKISVPGDATPGRRELRVVTDNGVTTAATFEIGASSIPEVVSAGDASSREKPQKLTLPVVVNGDLAHGGQRDWFAIDVKKGQRLTFNLKGYRLNEQSQGFFNPALYLYDASGNVVAKSTGVGGVTFGTDPVIDWTATADGTYTLLTRDLLYHGNPSSIYRLTIGSGLPYDAQFEPAVVVRPGVPVSASLAASVPIPAAEVWPQVSVPGGSSDGPMIVSTPAGDASVIVRDVHDGGTPVYGDLSKAASVVLPAAFHGAVTDPKNGVFFKVKTTRPNVPVYFTSASLGSPLQGWFIVTRPNGQYVNGYYADHATDFRFDNAFPTPGEYNVTVKDGANRSGMAYGFEWEAFDATPEFSLTATPDALNVSPGGSEPLTVRVTRRENIAGPIVLKVLGLPAGVTVVPATIPPDDDKATLVFESAPGAAVASARVSIVGTFTDAAGKTTTRSATPTEIYRINNGAYYPISRMTQTVAITGGDPAPPISIVIDGMENGIALAIDHETEIKVKLTRRPDFKGDLFIIPMNFPPGISMRGNNYLGGDKSELSLTLYADGNAHFLHEPRPTPNLAPMTVTFAVHPNGSGEFDYIACTPPIPLKLKAPDPPKK